MFEDSKKTVEVGVVVTPLRCHPSLPAIGSENYFTDHVPRLFHINTDSFEALTFISVNCFEGGQKGVDIPFGQVKQDPEKEIKRKKALACGLEKLVTNQKPDLIALQEVGSVTHTTVTDSEKKELTLTEQQDTLIYQLASSTRIMTKETTVQDRNLVFENNLPYSKNYHYTECTKKLNGKGQVTEQRVGQGDSVTIYNEANPPLKSNKLPPPKPIKLNNATDSKSQVCLFSVPKPLTNQPKHLCVWNVHYPFHIYPDIQEAKIKEDLDNFQKYCDKTSQILSKFSAEDIKNLKTLLGEEFPRIQSIESEKNDYKKFVFTSEEISAIQTKLHKSQAQNQEHAETLIAKLVAKIDFHEVEHVFIGDFNCNLGMVSDKPINIVTNITVPYTENQENIEKQSWHSPDGCVHISYDKQAKSQKIKLIHGHHCNLETGELFTEEDRKPELEIKLEEPLSAQQQELSTPKPIAMIKPDDEIIDYENQLKIKLGLQNILVRRCCDAYNQQKGYAICLKIDAIHDQEHISLHIKQWLAANGLSQQTPLRMINRNDGREEARLEYLTATEEQLEGLIQVDFCYSDAETYYLLQKRSFTLLVPKVDNTEGFQAFTVTAHSLLSHIENELYQEQDMARRKVLFQQYGGYFEKVNAVLQIAQDTTLTDDIKSRKLHKANQALIHYTVSTFGGERQKLKMFLGMTFCIIAIVATVAGLTALSGLTLGLPAVAVAAVFGAVALGGSLGIVGGAWTFLSGTQEKLSKKFKLRYGEGILHHSSIPEPVWYGRNKNNQAVIEIAKVNVEKDIDPVKFEAVKDQVSAFRSNCLSSVKPIADEAVPMMGGKWILKFGLFPDKELTIIQDLLKKGLIFEGEFLPPNPEKGFDFYTITLNVENADDKATVMRLYDIIIMSGLNQRAINKDEMEFKTDAKSLDGSAVPGTIHDPLTLETLAKKAFQQRGPEREEFVSENSETEYSDGTEESETCNNGI